MKPLFSALLLVLLYQYSPAQTNDIQSFSDNSYNRDIIQKNKLDTIYGVRHQGEETTIFIFCFDAQGNINYAFDINKAETDGNIYEYKYAKEGKLQLVVHYKLINGSEKKVDSTTYSYSKTGLLEKKTTFNVNGEKTPTSYTYFNQKLSEEISIIGVDKVITRYKYNSKDKIDTLNSLYVDGASKKETPISQQSYSYDAGGRLSSVKDSSLSIMPANYTATYFYSPQNALMAIEKTDGSYSNYSYNEKGLLEEREYSLPDPFRTGRLNGTETYTYIKRN